MRPALSVILFTVLSGFGYGLFASLALVDLFSLGADPRVFTTGCVVGLVLVTGGLLSSTLHLANPKNAWRAFSRFRTSWLSREGILALLFYLPALAYLGCWSTGDCGETARRALPLSVLLIALATVYSTGMIYACLKTIRQWHTPLTPAGYIALALMSGFLLFLLLHQLYTASVVSPFFLVIAIALIGFAALIKLTYYRFAVAESIAPLSTINTATSLKPARVRLLDVGHTGGTFLTEEFGYQVEARRLLRLRILSMLLAFGVPFLSLAIWAPVTTNDIAIIVAALSAAIGIVVERWLFFADARHVVNLYHGAQRT